MIRVKVRHFLDLSDYVQGGEAVFGGIWKVKKKLLPIFADWKEQFNV
jgi:hypothetical protein